MKTVPQLKNEIADLNSRTKSTSVQARIEHLQRQVNQILSADRREDRKLKARAIYIIGSTVMEAASQLDGQHVAAWLRDRVRSLLQKDQDVIRRAFPQVFSSSESSSTHIGRISAAAGGCPAKGDQ